MQARFERLPEAVGIRFVDPTSNYSGREGCVRWAQFVSFIRDPQNNITVVGIPPSNMGEYRVYILASDLNKVLAWMEEYGVLDEIGVLNVHDQ